MLTRSRFAAAGLAAMVLAVGATAHAAPIPVPNGDFQTGDKTGWNGPAIIVENAGKTGIGDYAAELSNLTWAQSLGQPDVYLTGEYNTNYVLNFDVRVLVASGQTHRVLIEAGWGQTVIGQFDIVDTDPTFADFEWHSVSMPFATSGVENQFRIMVRSQGVAGSVIHLDNFTIVPEPASLGILALGGIPLLRRRRHA